MPLRHSPHQRPEGQFGNTPKGMSLCPAAAPATHGSILKWVAGLGVRAGAGLFKQAPKASGHLDLAPRPAFLPKTHGAEAACLPRPTPEDGFPNDTVIWRGGLEGQSPSILPDKGYQIGPSA